jgi:hypothetical protein
MKYNMSILGQIVNLVIVYNLAPKSTKEEMTAWYKYALKHNLVEYKLDEHDKVIGFLDWVRLERVPATREEAGQIFNNQDHDIVQPVLMVLNAYAKDPGTLWSLRKAMLAKNENYEIGCYHRKKTDKMVVAKNRRRTNEFFN